MLGEKRFEHEIHFVVADNSAFYQEKPISQTHSPQAVQLARELNTTGNKYGIFVHYITASEMKQVFPHFFRQMPQKNPFVHLSDKNFRTSPGGATNIALSYIRGYQHRQHQDNKQLFLLRISDDTVPSTAKVKWLDTEQKFRNFFLDQQEIFAGNSVPQSYRGYDDSSGRRLRGSATTTSFIVRFGKLSNLPWYPTTQSEDFDFRSPKSFQSFKTPSYLIHASGESTWSSSSYGGRNLPSNIFGKYKFNKEKKVNPPKKRFVRDVIKSSGIQFTPSAIPSSRLKLFAKLRTHK